MKLRSFFQKKKLPRYTIALAGNPNVGKSSIFNALTGMRQHTGNWPGKTVSNARGSFVRKGRQYTLVDLPGTYSLFSHSREEEIARNFLCFEKPDLCIVVCDATCLERNLNLLLQCMELHENVMLCINLMDEAKRRGIRVEPELLEKSLGIPVAAVSAREKRSLEALLSRLDTHFSGEKPRRPSPLLYDPILEEGLLKIESCLSDMDLQGLPPRWLGLRLLENDSSLISELKGVLEEGVLSDPRLQNALYEARIFLWSHGFDEGAIRDSLTGSLLHRAEELRKTAVFQNSSGYAHRDRKLDRILTGRRSAYPLMLLLLALIFYLTLLGANYPSALLSEAFRRLEAPLSRCLFALGSPLWLHDLLLLGGYRVLSTVVSVMLPPMAVFFPLFTLLEDAGYLPRVAYNLDRPFAACSACGKQALTMAMGFGCNAVGVMSCRIIDSPRERLLAILTNSFVPCNGRLPMLLSLISLFLAAGKSSGLNALFAALWLTGFVLLGIGMSFLCTKLLSLSLLKGEAGAFTLELPPYRRPRFLQVLVRSFLDRSLRVLGRAALIAFPAGLLLYLLANVRMGEENLLGLAAAFLDPFARHLGLDGVLLLAFFLGFPANEIVIPIALMAYMQTGTLTEVQSGLPLKALLLANGWSWRTAVSFILFSLFHFPCSTTLLSIKKETGSLGWTLLAFLLPTAIGMFLCFLFHLIV